MTTDNVTLVDRLGHLVRVATRDAASSFLLDIMTGKTGNAVTTSSKPALFRRRTPVAGAPPSSVFGKERRRRRRRDAYDQSAMLPGIYLDRSSLMSISLHLFLGLVHRRRRRRRRRRRLRSIRPPLLRSLARSLARSFPQARKKREGAKTLLDTERPRASRRPEEQ